MDRQRSLAAAAIASAVAAVLLWIFISPAGRDARPPRTSAPPPLAAPTPDAAAPDPLSLPFPAPPPGPPPSWTRLLAPDGSDIEDAGVVAGIAADLLATVPISRRPPIADDADLARAITDAALTGTGEPLLPPSHPALTARPGRLVDRRGHPFHIHPLSSSLLQVRAAGPDGRLFTDDDVVEPRNLR